MGQARDLHARDPPVGDAPATTSSALASPSSPSSRRRSCATPWTHPRVSPVTCSTPCRRLTSPPRASRVTSPRFLRRTLTCRATPRHPHRSPVPEVRRRRSGRGDHVHGQERGFCVEHRRRAHQGSRDGVPQARAARGVVRGLLPGRSGDDEGGGMRFFFKPAADDERAAGGRCDTESLQKHLANFFSSEVGRAISHTAARRLASRASRRPRSTSRWNTTRSTAPRPTLRGRRWSSPSFPTATSVSSPPICW